MQKLCYVDPIYFIEHKLYNKINDSSCAYFDIFPEDLIQNYSPIIKLKNFPIYIASGIYDNILYYDVCKHKTENMYNLVISSNISVLDANQMLYVYINFDQNTESTDYDADMYIISYESEYESTGTLQFSTKIYFDTFQDLFGIIKNTIRQNTIKEIESK